MIEKESGENKHITWQKKDMCGKSKQSSNRKREL